MITFNKTLIKKYAIAFLSFIFGVVLMYLIGKHVVPFIYWLTDYDEDPLKLFMVSFLVIIPIVFRLIFSYTKSRKRALTFCLLFIAGSLLGSSFVWSRISGIKKFRFNCGYSKIENKIEYPLNHKINLKIGLVNKWGIKVVPQTCDLITLITDDTMGEDAFLGFILKDDSLKIYFYGEGEKGIFKEKISLDSLKRINSYVDQKYGSVKANYLSFTMYMKFKHFEKNYIEKENYSENHKEAIDVDDSHHNLNNTDNVVTPEQQTIVVEHKYQPRIVQKWQNCGGCGGSTLCGTCGGSGRNPFSSNPYEECPQCHGNRKCTMCGGRGGYYYEAYE